jgi:hypothetical protein
MTEESDAETNQPVFHGSPKGNAPALENDIGRNTKLAAGLAVGIGSAALVAALLYARRTKTKAAPRTPSVEPSD